MLALLAPSKPAEWSPWQYATRIWTSAYAYTAGSVSWLLSPKIIDHHTKEGCAHCSCLHCKPCICGRPVPSVRYFRIMFGDCYPRVHDCVCVDEIPNELREACTTIFFCNVLRQDIGSRPAYIHRIILALLSSKEFLDPQQIAGTIDMELRKTTNVVRAVDASTNGLEDLRSLERHTQLCRIRAAFFNVEWSRNTEPVVFKRPTMQ